jgi:DNA topoisomerase-3
MMHPEVYAMRLILAEKPSVARDLAAVMDPGAKRGDGCLQGAYATWTWALGHLAELAPPEHYVADLAGRWRLDLLPVIPSAWALRPREDGAAAKQLRVVRSLLAKASEVVVATDAGREGELIWAYVREVCGYRGPAKRLWLSETTPAAVRAAFAALREPPVHLEAAARARAQADWLVGMNATMALSARHGGLWSAGRESSRRQHPGGGLHR